MKTINRSLQKSKKSRFFLLLITSKKVWLQSVAWQGITQGEARGHDHATAVWGVKPLATDICRTLGRVCGGLWAGAQAEGAGALAPERGTAGSLFVQVCKQSADLNSEDGRSWSAW